MTSLGFTVAEAVVMERTPAEPASAANGAGKRAVLLQSAPGPSQALRRSPFDTSHAVASERLRVYLGDAGTNRCSMTAPVSSIAT